MKIVPSLKTYHWKMAMMAGITSLVVTSQVFAQSAINRKELVERHKVINTSVDTLASLTVGNGKFAFTADVTGLQTFPRVYQKGVPLGTQSEWGWNSFTDTAGYKREEALKAYHLNGRDITYLVQWSSVGGRNKQAADWFRANPHRLQLGNLGFEIVKKDGTLVSIEDLQNIHQELNPWTGEIQSQFSVEGVPVTVSTYCHGKEDVIAARVQSALLQEGRLKVRLQLPYPTGEWADYGTNYTHVANHTSTIQSSNANGAWIRHRLQTADYFAGFTWKTKAVIAERAPHDFLITPDKNSAVFEFTCLFTPRKTNTAFSFALTKASSEKELLTFWTKGGVVDFTGSTNARAPELERRIVLSQYLMKVQEAGTCPPQETGLTYNSWYGKAHLEMPYWHLTHYPLWGRTEYLEKVMTWYAKVAPFAKGIAKRQGYEGIRWQKVVENTGEEVPSSVGAFLIWQQPHYIYFAELIYRNRKDSATLRKYKDLLFATADFMASFAYYDKETKRYILGKGLIPAQERFKAESTFNPTYELVYWRWGLETAQQWRERLGLPRNKKWDEVLAGLSPLPVQDSVYLAAESATDSYTNPEYKTDHPSVLAAYGVLPKSRSLDTATMRRTFDLVWNTWTWADTWGWDFPMTAMTATRLGLPDKAMDALFMPVKTNTYLKNGHNYQENRLTLYMPGNGGLLSAVSMMVAGYEGSAALPGIPKDGTWKVKWEGLKKMP
ncbi:hypothetical protein SAMN05421788_105268 [Filimonas lacunae]|uniref:Glycosyl hydrolase family 65, N-terminal domain n=1 Tax=Filimonas lacunae TaxID=477680 RepID=A0A1N7QH85_9BACT|nr:hypothetical protein [Filimonas lacunae]SIT22271.1 hypothetical protein SAMN05421788_105268 [Filimonas lacunae]